MLFDCLVKIERGAYDDVIHTIPDRLNSRAVQSEKKRPPSPVPARALGRPDIAKRASFSGGYGAAKAIAEKYGQDESDSRQVSLADVDGTDTRAECSDGATAHTDGLNPTSTADEEATVPVGAGSTAGEPSPDDQAVVETAAGDDDGDGRDAGGGDGADTGDRTDAETEQTTMGHFG